MSRRLKSLILISVALNILLIGFVLGIGSRCYHTELKRTPGIAVLLENSSVPEARRTELEKKLQALFPDAEKRKARLRLYRKTSEILKAEEFDSDAFREQLDKMFEYRRLNRQKRIEVITEIASELNQEERKVLAEIFGRRFVRE